MGTLREKLTASAAQRLKLPPGRTPWEEVDRYRNYLKVETQRLKILHRNGESGRAVCRARAWMLDLLLEQALGGMLAALAGRYRAEPLALVGLGGYGRGELNPCSDIDILTLHDRRVGQPSPLLHALMERLVPFVTDIKLDSHPLVRNLDDCVREANRDMRSKTAMIEARLITGDARLFAQMKVMLEDRCIKGHEEEYIEARLQDQDQRHTKWGQSVCLLEPNIKSGCGGLRDFQNLLWMAYVKYSVRGLDELVNRRVLSPTAQRQLEQAYDFLLRVRNELHYQHGRRGDLLTRDLQPVIASQLGYAQRSQGQRVEQFMGDYYRHARSVYLTTRTLERRLALRPPGRLVRLGRLLVDVTPFREGPVDGLRFKDGELRPASSRIFREQPRRLIKAFFHAQQRGLRLHPDLEDLIRAHLSLVNRAFLADQHVHQTFLEILNHRGNVAPALRAMHDTGFLGKYVAPFGDLTCRVQHEFFHVYTADEHTLMCLAMVDRIWDTVSEPFVHYRELFRRLERPYVLYLALLLHDVGKANDGADHASGGARLAHQQARRLHLNAEVEATLAFLVQHHLLMSQLSQKRDLDDPAVVHSFADTAKTPERLDLLTLHTFADSMGTSETLWTGFKESLLWTLHRQTTQVLAGDAQFLEGKAERRRRLEAEVRSLVPRTIGDDEVRAHYANLPPRYLEVNTPREIATDMTLANRFMWNQLAFEDQALNPVVAWQLEPDRGYASVKVCTWDRAGLFSRIAGALAAVGINILSARIYSRADGIIFDALYVNDPVTGKPPAREQREQFEALLTRALNAEVVDFGAQIAAHHSGAPLYQPAAHQLIPTLVKLDNAVSKSATVIEIQAEDRVGLLYDLTRTLAEMGLDISFARISTEKGAAIDTFYVAEAEEGEKVTAKERLRDVERRLRAVLPARRKPS